MPDPQTPPAAADQRADPQPELSSSPGLTLANTDRDAALMARASSSCASTRSRCRPTAARRRRWRGSRPICARSMPTRSPCSTWPGTASRSAARISAARGRHVLPEPADARAIAAAARGRHRPVPRRLPEQSLRQCRRRRRRAQPHPHDPRARRAMTSASRRSAWTSCAARRPRRWAGCAPSPCRAARSRSSSRPTRPMSPSTAPGPSSRNSPFAEALARHIRQPISLDDIVALTTGDVVRATRRMQSPWSQGSIDRPIFLSGRGRRVQTPSAAEAQSAPTSASISPW